MTERVQVDPSEIEVGDLIEVDYVAPYYKIRESITYRAEVTAVDMNGIVSPSFNFPLRSTEGYTFYRLPKPAPEEPKGLGAVVEVVSDGETELWVRIDNSAYPWYAPSIADDQHHWSGVTDGVENVKVLSDGYTA